MSIWNIRPLVLIISLTSISKNYPAEHRQHFGETVRKIWCGLTCHCSCSRTKTTNLNGHIRAISQETKDFNWNFQLPILTTLVAKKEKKD